MADQTNLTGLAGVVVGASWSLASHPPPVNTPVPTDNQSVELPGEERARSSHFRKDEELIRYRFDDAKTLYETFQRGKRLSNDGPCLGWRPGPEEPYQWISYSDVEKRALDLGAGLKKLGVDTGQDAFVGICSQNNVDWVVTEQSCNAYSRPLVPLYDTLGPDVVSYIINKACISLVVCHPAKISLLFQQASSCKSLRLIVKMGSSEVTEEERDEAKKTGITIYSMSEVEQMGREEPLDVVPPTPDDTATVCFTSGTTGDPKGAILTHENIMSNVAGTYVQMESSFAVTPEDVHISYLPLAHMMERIAQAMLFMGGAKIGFYQGDIKLLSDDIQALHPTVFVSVPRLLNRVYDKVMAGISASSFKTWLFEVAMASKLREVQHGILRRDSIWDYIVFRKIQNLLGGRIRFIMTSSAPISEKVMNFLRCGFGCQVFEGYGQTECTAGCTFTLPGDFSTGHVGPPMCCGHVKLVDVKDMDYFAANGEGEVCVKGPAVIKGYLKDPEKTAEAIDKDGWLHTGDIGRWLPNGALKIIDRKKHIFKLAQGEYIAPEKVENVYKRSLYVAQAYLHGDSLKSACVAIIVPDEEVMTKWAQDNRVTGTFEDLCKSEDVKKLIFDDITRVGQELGLQSFEQAKAIKLHSEPFSVENGLLTPTFKKKRTALKAQFLETFDQLYSEISS